MKRLMILLVIWSLSGSAIAQVAESDTAFSLADTVLANANVENAKRMIQAGKYDSANAYLIEAQRIYQSVAEQTNDVKWWAKMVYCFTGRGNIYIRKGDLVLADSILNSSLLIARKYLPESHQRTIQCYINLGVVALYRGNFQLALNNSNTALALAVREFGEHSQEAISAHTNIGGVYYRLGDLRAALKEYRETLNTAKHLGQESYEVGANLSNLGTISWEMGDLDQALSYHSQALAIRKKLFPEDHPEIAGSFNNIGLVFFERGDYQQALEYYQRALQIRLAKMKADHFLLTENYINIGEVYFDIGEFEKAISFYEKALEITIENLDKNNPVLATCYSELGSAYAKLNQPTKAIVFHRKAKAIFTRSNANQPQVGRQEVNIGNIYFKQGRLEEAETRFQKALAIYEKNFKDHHPDIAAVRRKIGDVYLKRREFDSALMQYQAALMAVVPNFQNTDIAANPALDDVILEKELLKILKSKAKALQLYARHQKTTPLSQIALLKYSHRTLIKMAQQTWQRAVDLVDSLRISYHSSNSRLLLNELAATIYNQAITNIWQLKDFDQPALRLQPAFYYSEKSKASLLGLQLQESFAKKFSGIPDSTLTRERRLRIDLGYYARKILEQKRQLKPENPGALPLLEKTAFDLRQEYQRLMKRIEREYPRYHRLKYQTTVAAVADVQTALDDQTALLEYFIGDSAVYIFTITKGEYHITEVSKPADFDSLANAYHLALAKIKPADYRKLTPLLYETLIAPVEAFFHGKHKLVIIPDGVLHRIPFETLAPAVSSKTDFKRLDYLLKHYDISYHYSAKLYLDQVRQTERRYVKDFIGFAPVFADAKISRRPVNEDTTAIETPDVYRFRGVQFNGERYAELKYTKREVTEIRHLFEEHGKSGDIFLNQDADEEMVKSEMLGDYRYVHLATHGFVDLEEPRFSGLIFSQPATLPAKEDGILFAGEAYNLHLNADLVVLSACETGFGKIYRGEGAMALTRGFLYSGARNLVTSYWSVPDKSTGELMAAFYKNILEGKNYAKSLRAAKLKQLEKEATAFPGQWGAFVLIGE